MDLTKITDIKEIKALAYDQIILIEQSTANLRMLQQRITELSAKPEKG